MRAYQPGQHRATSGRHEFGVWILVFQVLASANINDSIAFYGNGPSLVDIHVIIHRDYVPIPNKQQPNDLPLADLVVVRNTLPKLKPILFSPELR